MKNKLHDFSLRSHFLRKVALIFLFLFLFQTFAQAASFAEIEREWFERLMTSDSLTFHILMKEPANFGLLPIAPTWGGGYSREEFDAGNALFSQLSAQLEQINSRELIHERDKILHRILTQRA
ncbi:MAG: hypothetical protein FWD19_06625, partial [Defluviitaleaceae bacterium]|nr:hypothetical protein [Defluviitaleaceae bacterium]